MTTPNQNAAQTENARLLQSLKTADGLITEAMQQLTGANAENARLTKERDEKQLKLCEVRDLGQLDFTRANDAEAENARLRALLAEAGDHSVSSPKLDEAMTEARMALGEIKRNLSNFAAQVIDPPDNIFRQMLRECGKISRALEDKK